MIRYRALWIGLSLLLLAACGLGAQAPNEPEASVNQLAPAGVSDGIIAEEQSGLQLASAVQPVQERIVLKNASLSLTVDDATLSINQIAQLAEALGGWVVSSNTSKISRSSGDVIQGTITIRVPSASFEDALSQIKANATSVDTESVTGQDVTQEYTDLTSQLNNLRAAETQLQAIMENARTTNDVLTIYNELVRVRGEIETTQGRIRYYEESAAFSSISANLVPPSVDAPIQIAGWSPGRTAESALAALVNILRLIVDVLITLLILVVPLVVIFVIPGWLIARILTRRGIIRRPISVSPVPPAQE
jgi:hypothetical protein